MHPHRVSHPNIINKTDDHKTIQYTFNPKTKQKTDDTPAKPVFEKTCFKLQFDTVQFILYPEMVQGGGTLMNWSIDEF